MSPITNRAKARMLLLVVLAATLAFLCFHFQENSSRGSAGTIDRPNSAASHDQRGTNEPVDQGGSAYISANALPRHALLGTQTVNSSSPDGQGRISLSALKQIAALEDEKSKRTSVEQRIDSQLLHADKIRRGVAVAAGVSTQRLNLDRDDQGRVLVDIKADVTESLLERIGELGGNVVSSFPEYRAIQAGIPLSGVETLAAQQEVTFIQPVVRSTQNVTSAGDYTHQANTARINFGVTGAGVRVGVIADSVDYLSDSEVDGLVTILPGQSGVPDAGEGTAMLEIINDLAPQAKLYFATRGTSAAQFASNIRNLRSTYGCDIIVDDILYHDESPFQDGLVAQAVNDVTASGALYFSSASNSGNKNSGTSGTWEGDFLDGGQAPSELTQGRVHSFGGINYNTVLGTGPGGNLLRLDLFWADPLGASTNDYDVYVLDPTGTSVVASSINSQTGFQDPYESLPSLSTGERIVVVKYSGANRFLHLDTGRGRLAISTQGSTRGHNCATNAFGVAATDANNSYPNAFTGGSANPVETYSSDGPRRVFFEANGTPITPGDFTSSGGFVRQKPDITAATKVMTSVPGFAPFTGTSAAAPHAAAIAALLKSYNRSLTPAQIRTILSNTALDIMGAGTDRDSGVGIVMALAALTQTPAAPPVEVPTTIAGKTFLMDIVTGDYPFIAEDGYFLLVPANTGNSFQMVGIFYNAGFYNIGIESGTYSYSANANGGWLTLTSVSDTFVGPLDFVHSTSGNYSVSNTTSWPINIEQSGVFDMFQVPAPVSIAGKTISAVIQDGVQPFAPTGTGTITFAPSGNTYTNAGDGVNTANSSGTYSYSRLNSTTGRVQMNDALGGTFIAYLMFSSAVEGEYVLTQAASGSFQVAHFVLVDTTRPTLAITSPTSGARLTNSIATVQGTAADDFQIAGVAYQLNTNDWAVASGTTNWAAANIMLVPGTNTFRAFAQDTTGNRSTTNSVSFVHVVNEVLAIRATGQGTVSPNYSNAALEIGRWYTNTAAGINGHVFTSWAISTNWIGGVTSNNPTLRFLMQSNLTLQVNFLDIQKPTVSISNPPRSYTNSQTVTISATSSDNVGVTNVAFYAGTALKSSGAAPPYSYDWSITAADNGPHAWTARAYDAAGNVATSSVVTLTVSIDTNLPLVVISSPINGANLTTSSTTVSGTASDPGFPASGLSRVEVRVNSGNWSNATGTASWSRTVTLLPCGNTIEVRSRDNAGNYSAIASNYVTFTPPNTLPNTPTNISPVAGARNVSVTPILQASPFTDPDPACLSDVHAASQWQVLNRPGTVVVADSGTDTVNRVSWTIPPGKLHYGSNYQWQVRYRDSRNGWSSYSARTFFTNGGPSLVGVKLGANFVLNWPTNSIGFGLQWSTNLGSANWSNATPSPVIVNGQYAVTNTATNSFRFYRLRK